MDLIASITQQLGVDPGAARALAGGVLGGLRDRAADEMGPQTAAKIDDAVPELGDWRGAAQQAVEAPSGGLGGAMGGLLGGAMGALGGGGGAEVALVAQLIGKLGLDADKAAMLAPLAVKFLESRLDPDTVQKVRGFLPMLGGGGGGGLGGALGGLLG